MARIYPARDRSRQKAAMTDRIARLRIELLHRELCIWRSVEVSLTTNLRALHKIVQAVMPWESHHLSTTSRSSTSSITRPNPLQATLEVAPLPGSPQQRRQHRFVSRSADSSISRRKNQSS
jgi:hypothetical protein